MDKKMETTIMGYIGVIGYILRGTTQVSGTCTIERYGLGSRV